MFYLIRATFFICFCLIKMRIVSSDICEFCQCGGSENDEFMDIRRNDSFIHINCTSETILGSIIVDLENIQWPTNNKSLHANFNNMRFTGLPKVLGSATVKLINLDNNFIETIVNDPFRQCKNLESISISNNSLHNLPMDLLKSTTLLRHLNLSHNKLSDIDSITLSHLTKLHCVDLSYNKLKILSAEVLIMLDNVEILNLKGNEIIFVQSAERLTSLKNLNLANNRLTLVGVTTFQYLQNLEILDLSNNFIELIEQQSFEQLTSLKFLDISNNLISQLSLTLPNNIYHFITSSNRIKKWPLTNFPKTLTHLEIQHNDLKEMFSTKWFTNNLKILNVSHNSIDFLPNVEYSELEILDLSFNAFTSVPKNLGSQASRLDTLILDHNPINNIDFMEPVYLRKLSLRNMSILEDLSDAALRNVDGQGNCMEVIISHCEKLSNIGDNSMRHLDICRLDLSYNNLTSIPESLTNWTKLNEGVNIQGNPFECNCSLQWMLDVILMRLYRNESNQHLLYNLKCAGPDELKDHRFVKYYRKNAAFCNSNSAMAPHQIQLSSFAQSPTYHLSLTAGPGCIIVIVLSVICLILFIVVAIMWNKRQRRRLQRQDSFYRYFQE